jgi:hypothetical protein
MSPIKDYHKFLKIYYFYQNVYCFSRMEMNWFLNDNIGQELKEEVRNLFLNKDNRKLMFSLNSSTHILKSASRYILKKNFPLSDHWSNCYTDKMEAWCYNNLKDIKITNVEAIWLS